MLRRVKNFIEQHQLLSPADKVIVGLSGGADSVALLDLLLRLNYNCLAVHCNFHLRAEESVRDEQFVRQLCDQLQVPLIVHNFQTADYAKQNHISLEMAARDLRYNLFQQLLEENHCSAIAVAHHQNDQAETVLLNLYRGTGIRGRAGMKPRNGNIIRPLLSVTHDDILDYLTLRGFSHVEDSTNSDTSIPRNLIRQQLHQLPPSAVKHISSTANLIRGYHTLANAYITQISPNLLSVSGNETRINIPQLLLTPAPETILYELLRPYSFTQSDEIFLSLTSTSGRQFFSDTHIALKDRDYLIIYEKNTRETTIPRIITSVRNKRPQETFPHQSDFQIIADSKILLSPLSLRHFQPGDRFTPFGMTQSRKLQDFFSDLKLTRKQKQETWLLLSGDEIAWVVGYRLSNKFKVTSRTSKVALITLISP